MLLHYRLGDSLGDDIACKIRDLDGTKIIIISAYDLEREKVDALKTCDCIIDMMVKPVSLKALIDSV
jgi:DNA-binding response OmpR family regulator